MAFVICAALVAPVAAAAAKPTALGQAERLSGLTARRPIRTVTESPDFKGRMFLTDTDDPVKQRLEGAQTQVFVRLTMGAMWGAWRLVGPRPFR